MDHDGPGTRRTGRPGPGALLVRAVLAAGLGAALALAGPLLGTPVLAGVLPVGSGPADATPTSAAHDEADGHDDHVHATELTPVDVLERRTLAAAAGAELGAATPVAASAGTGPVCSGTGSDGRRIEVVYAHTSATPSASVLDGIAAAVTRVDATFRDSAARSGGVRTVRWVTTSGSSCSLLIRTVPIDADATATGTLFADLITAGLSDPARKYLVWTEGEITSPPSSTCGIGEYWPDDRPGVDNANANADGTWGPTFAAMDARCWDVTDGHSVPAHELMHMLGAVQDSAPHATGDGHCTDDYDAMCYGPSTVVVPGCTSPSAEALFDCNHDDYFSADPVAGSYLCTRWNTARSPYLFGSADLAPPRAPPITAVSTAAGRVTVTWAASPSCVPADGYAVSLSSGASAVVSGATRSVTLSAPTGPVVVSVVPYRGGVAGTASTQNAVVPAAVVNRPPVGQVVVLSTDGPNLAVFGYALDPDTDAPIQVVVAIDGVGWFPVRADLAWADVPRRHPGYSDRHAFLYGRQLPSGTRNVCVVASDAAGGPSTSLGCTRVSVK